MGKKNTNQHNFYRSLLGDQYMEDVFPIAGKVIPCAVGKADLHDLNYWVDNPRVYDEVHSSGIDPDEISTEHIFKKLSKYKDCIDLKSRILKSGGQRDAVIVARDISGKTNKFIVYEGNTRLASLTSLLKDGVEGDWKKIKVCLLDLDGFDPELVITYIGDIHLEDEKNRWATHKGARYYYRLVKAKIAQGSTPKESFAEVAEKFSDRITKGHVERNYEIIEFMEVRGMEVLQQESQYSYWKEYFQNSRNKEVRKYFNDPKNLEGKVNNSELNAYDNKMVEQVSKNIVKAATGGDNSFRSLVKKVSDFFYTHPSQAEKTIYDFIDGKVTLLDASKTADEGGASDREYKMIKDFHTKLFKSDPRELRKAVLKHENLLDLVKDIQNELKTTHMDLKAEYEKFKNRRDANGSVD